jgi:para-aminobenzoate synthetase/4-amino-4-deoxychorismate lyase
MALIESLLWNGGLMRLERHMARLEHSAETLGFEFDEAIARQALGTFTGRLDGGAAHKIRLQLDRSGAISVSADPLSAKPASSQKVMLAAVRVDSQDALLRHKTTCRQVFNAAGARADQMGLADLIFLNEHGELTEGSRNNVFVRIQGRLLTPPVESGLLPGVFRQAVLDADPQALVQPLPLATLLRAEAVFLCNSVRGWRQVSLINETVEICPSR